MASPRQVVEPTPRLLTRAEAAAYCRLAPSSFDAWVIAGRLPKAIPDTHRWDRRAIDSALDKISGLTPNNEPSALDAWMAEHARAS